MGLKQYRQAYKAAFVSSFFETGENNPEYLMARAAAGFPDRKLCLKHLRLALKTGKVQKERVINDPLLFDIIGKDTIDKLFADQ